MKRFLRVFILGVVVLMPTGLCKADELVACTCTVKGDDVSCQTQFGNRVPVSFETLDAYFARCQVRECFGDSCIGGEKLMHDVNAVAWGTYRSNYVPPAEDQIGKYRADGETAYCASEYDCDKCKYYRARAGLPAGDYCSATAHDKKPILGWMDCPNNTEPCNGPPSPP